MATTPAGRGFPVEVEHDDLLYCFDWGTVLSNRDAVEDALPRFVHALDGDAATDPNS